MVAPQSTTDDRRTGPLISAYGEDGALGPYVAQGVVVLNADGSIPSGGPLSSSQLPASLGPKAQASSLAVTPSGVGISASASFTPTAVSYTALNIIDVAKEMVFTYSDGTAIPAGSLIRILSVAIKIDATALISGEASYQLQLYSVTPPSAQANNAAWVLASADLPSYRGSVPLGTPVVGGTGGRLYLRVSNINYDVKLGATTGVSLFAELQNTGTFTGAAVARQIFVDAIIL